MGSRHCPLVAAGAMVLVAVMAVVAWGIVLGVASASPVRQFPINSVTIFSDPPPPDEPGQFSEATLLQANPLDPGGSPAWRLATFDDGSWQPSYAAAMLAGWGSPVGGAHPLADFVWGGLPGADAGGRYEIPASPAPQFLFLRKNFCIPINAHVDSIQATTPLHVQVAADPGDASIYYNGADIGSLPGREDGFVYHVNLDAAVSSARRLGRNTLAMRVHDGVGDPYAAVAYYLRFSYGINAGAITINSNPPSGSVPPGASITFSQGGAGPGGDAPHVFSWDFGDGTTSADPAPSKVYDTAGTYTVTLIVIDSFGCPSAPVSTQYMVSAPTPTDTPTPTSTPTPTNTPTPTSTPVPANTPVPRPPQPQPTSTPIVLPTPTLLPAVITPVLLPATGDAGRPVIAGFVFPIAGGVLLVVTYLLLRRYLAYPD